MRLRRYFTGQIYQKGLILLLEDSLYWFCRLFIVSICHERNKLGVVHLYINECLQILVQTRQVIFSLFIICNEALLLLQQALARLFERFPNGEFVLYAREHKGFLIIIDVFGVLL